MNLAAVCQSCDITLSEDTSASCRPSQQNAHKTFNATSSFTMHMQKRKQPRKRKKIFEVYFIPEVRWKEFRWSFLKKKKKK